MSINTPRTQDPICGMVVPQASEHRIERDGEVVCFCSDHCRQKYLSVFVDAESGAAIRADDID